jgi:flagellum-specific ATP synthase
VDVVSPHEREVVNKAVAAISVYSKSKDLIDVGAYRSGSNAELDAALRILPDLNKFMCQRMDEAHARSDGMVQLRKIFATTGK